MKKKQQERVIRPKENVTLRYKELSNGNKSLYLDIYNKGERSYEFLKLYLLPEQTEQDKQRNQEVLTQAEIARLQRSLDMLLPPPPPVEETLERKLSLTDWLHTYSLRKKEKGQSDAFSLQIDKTIWHLLKYRKEKTAIEDINKDFCRIYPLFKRDPSVECYHCRIFQMLELRAQYSSERFADSYKSDTADTFRRKDKIIGKLPGVSYD